MNTSYVQYLNVGFGIINNTKVVSSWNLNDCIEEALFLNDPNADILIIGFRFYDIDNETKNVVKRGGINYLQGEVFTYPKVDNDMMAFLRSTNKEYERGQKLIKISKPNTIIYPFNDDDCILDIEPYLASIKAKKTEEEIKNTNIAIENYKQNLVNIIRSIADCIENNSFNKIPTVDSPYKEEEKYLDILNDGGNFAKHIDYLRNERLHIITLEKTLNELKQNQRRY